MTDHQGAGARKHQVRSGASASRIAMRNCRSAGSRVLLIVLLVSQALAIHV